MGKNLLDDCTQRVMGCYLEPVTSGIAQGSVLSFLDVLIRDHGHKTGDINCHAQRQRQDLDSDLGRAEEQANRGKEKWKSWTWVRRIWHHVI